MPNTSNENTKPFLRWAGGKSWLVKHLDKLISNINYNNYHEPFLGGGAVFFSLAPSNISYLSDLNHELIVTYQAIKEDPIPVINVLRTYENNEEFYYRIRSQKPSSPTEQAARFIYLNQTSYNGIYRVNQRGEYNVPFGNRSKNFLEEEKLIAASRCLQRANIMDKDFSECRNDINEGDLVFLDPPYTVSHNQNGFIKYNQRLFSLDDQYRLSELIDYINEVGAYFILTNAAHQVIDDIFGDKGRKIVLSRASLIGGENARRGQVKEYIFTNIPRG